MLYSRIEGEGQPLVVIHGFLGMSDNWKSLGDKWVEDGFQVHILDLRNHGKSFHSDDFSYSIMAQDVKEYLDFHHLENVYLIGHSMGGKVAMLFATEYPDYVSKLIIADISPRFYAPHHQTILEALNAVDFSKKPSRAEVDAIISKFINDFGTKQFLLKNLYWKEPGQLAFRFNLKVFMENQNVIGEALPENNKFYKPTLFLRGEKSDYITSSDEELIKFHFPNYKIETVLNAGHWLHAENPVDFMDKIKHFID